MEGKHEETDDVLKECTKKGPTVMSAKHPLSKKSGKILANEPANTIWICGKPQQNIGFRDRVKVVLYH